MLVTNLCRRIQTIPWLELSLCALLIAIALLWVLNTGLGHITKMTCQRQASGQIDCIVRQSYLGFNRSAYVVSGLQEAQVIKNRRWGTSRPTASTYWVALVTKAGTGPLTGYKNTDNQTKEVFVAQVNGFIANQRAPTISLLYLEQAGVVPYFLLIAIVVVYWRWRRNR